MDKDSLSKDVAFSPWLSAGKEPVCLTAQRHTCVPQSDPGEMCEAGTNRVGLCRTLQNSLDLLPSIQNPDVFSKALNFLHRCQHTF